MGRIVLAAVLAASALPAVADTFPDYLVIRDRFAPRDIGGGRQRELNLLARIVDETGAVVFEELHCAVPVSGNDGETELSLGTVDPAANPLALRFSEPWSVVVLACPEAACDGPSPPDASLCGGDPLLDKPLQVVAYAWRAKHAAEADHARYADDCDRLDGLDSADFMPAGADHWVNESGDAMTGPLMLSGDPTIDAQAATKKYVDEQIRNAIPRGYAILGPTPASPPGFTAPGDFVWPAARIERLQDVPAPGPAHAASLGDTLYVWSETVRDALFAWRAGVWTTILGPPMGSAGGIAAVSAKLHLVSSTSEHWTYEPATDAWTRRAPTPGSPGSSPMVAELDGALYVLFAALTSAPPRVPTLFSRYDEASDSWVSLPAVPRDLPGQALVGFDGHVWALGARRDGWSAPSREGSRETWLYEPTSAAWRQGSRLNVAGGCCYGTLQAAVVDGRLWLLSEGGSNDGYLGADRSEESVRFDSIGSGESTWQESPSCIAAPRTQPGMAALEGRLHVVGGVIGVNRYDNVSDHESFTPPRRWFVHVKD